MDLGAFTLIWSYDGIIRSPNKLCSTKYMSCSIYWSNVEGKCLVLPGRPGVAQGPCQGGWVGRVKLRTAAMLRGEMLGSAGPPAAFKLSRDHAKNAERNEKYVNLLRKRGGAGPWGPWGLTASMASGQEYMLRWHFLVLFFLRKLRHRSRISAPPPNSRVHFERLPQAQPRQRGRERCTLHVRAR